MKILMNKIKRKYYLPPLIELIIADSQAFLVESIIGTDPDQESDGDENWNGAKEFGAIDWLDDFSDEDNLNDY